ncbi:MAG: neutral zinc metallopeptidase, partial [Acidimicrobiales bacterium]
MRFRRGARLDSSQVSDRRGMGGAGAVVGGGGVVGVIIFVLVSVLGGGGGGGGLNPGDLGLNGPLDLGQGSGQAGELSDTCRTGADANQRDDCRIVAVVNSVQDYWTDTLEGYQAVDTTFFSGGTNTACGQASSATGPFYCPLDSKVYIDLSFFDELRRRFGA